jgi:hypothetical protein
MFISFLYMFRATVCPSSAETTVFMHSRPKHTEKRNNHTKKNCAPSWLCLQDYTGIHGQQNVKKYGFITASMSIPYATLLIFPFNPLNQLEQSDGYFYH